MANDIFFIKLKILGKKIIVKKNKTLIKFSQYKMQELNK